MKDAGRNENDDMVDAFVDAEGDDEDEEGVEPDT